VSWFSAAANFVTPEIMWGSLIHKSEVWSDENRRCLATRHAIAQLMRMAKILNWQFGGEGRTYFSYQRGLNVLLDGEIYGIARVFHVLQKFASSKFKN
jgi:hypothetical protein